jgi:hypothetical protein
MNMLIDKNPSFHLFVDVLEGNNKFFIYHINDSSWLIFKELLKHKWI